MGAVIRSLIIGALLGFPVEGLWGQTGKVETPSPSRLPDQALTLSEAVDIALDSNPLIQMTLARRDEAAAGLREATAGRLPSLQFNETFTNSNNPVYVFGTLLEQGAFQPHHFDVGFLNNPGSMSNFRSSLDLAVPVFNRFKVASGINQARLGGEQAEAEFQWTEQKLRYKVIEAFYGVLVAEARQNVAEEAVKTAESDLNSMKTRHEQGMVVESDLLSMQVQVAEFRQQLVQASGEVQTARAALNTVLSLPVDHFLSLDGDLVDRTFQMDSKEELIDRALRLRPDYRQTDLQVKVAEEKITEGKGQYWPDLKLFAQVGHSGQDWAGGSGDFAVGAKVSFNVIDFGRAARVEKAAAAAANARAQRVHAANGIRFEVVQAYQQLKTSEERLRVASASIDQAVEALRIVQDRYEVGLTTTTEVLRAQTAVLRARLLRLSARYDYFLGYAKTLLVSGSLSDVSPFAD